MRASGCARRSSSTATSGGWAADRALPGLNPGAAAVEEWQDDLNAERKAIQKQWAKRETQIDTMIAATTGMFGDLQGIAGKSLQEIEGMQMLELEG